MVVCLTPIPAGPRGTTMVHQTRVLRGHLKSVNRPGLRLPLAHHHRPLIILDAPHVGDHDHDLLRQSVEDGTQVRQALVVVHQVIEAAPAETSAQIASIPNHLYLMVV